LTDATEKPTRPAPALPAQIWVTPRLATEWLNLNPNNRKLRPTHAETFQRDMEAGEWHEEIIAGIHFVTEDGLLGDGQHRLRAIELSGLPQWCLVQNVPRSAIAAAVDRGARRSATDALHFHGVTASPVQAAVARKILQMEAGFAPGGAGRFKPSDREIQAKLTGPDADLISEASNVALAIRKGDKLKVRASNLAMAYYVCAKVDPACAKEFYITQILKSEGMTYESPANALVRRMQNAKNQKMTEVEQYNYVIHAWNHYRNGNILVKLQAPTSWGPNGYAVPV
jgi:hypothetical protein